MIRIAICEDQHYDINVLVSYLKRYEKDNKEEFNISVFDNPVNFLTNYPGIYDLIFLDIVMPDLNGIKVAQKLRVLDSKVCLVFVTSMAQYAVRGYEVNAYDFIVKPINYYDFALKLQRSLDYIKSREIVKILLNVDDGVLSIDSSEIKYVEIVKHKIIYHTTRGEYRSHGTLKNAEEILNSPCFARCNSCYLVNLNYVSSVKDFTLTIGEEQLMISHPKKKAFMTALNEYFGGRFRRV